MKKLRIDLSIALFKLSLAMLALVFALNRRMRREILDPERGFVFNARIQIGTRDGKVLVHLVFREGRVRFGSGPIGSPDVVVSYRDEETLARLYSENPEDSIDNLLTNDMSYTGNMAYLTKFTYLTALVKGAKVRGYVPPEEREVAIADIDSCPERWARQNETLDRKIDAVAWLDDPYLGRYGLDDFPRLKRLKNRRFALKPAICVERAYLFTRYHREHGFETDPVSGASLDPELRQAEALRYALENKKPLIWEDNLVPGSTTSKEFGVPIYPELVGTTIWPELASINRRALNPYDISPEEAEILDREVFPFWMDRNVREYCRKKFGNPLSQRLEERWVLYFMMKNNAISHTVPDFHSVAHRGLQAIRDLAAENEARADTEDKRNFYKAMRVCLEGVFAYAARLAEEATRQAAALDPSRPGRAAELREMARICGKVPMRPAQSVHEGVTSIWIAFTCLQMENANSALSIGRLDRILQPLFLADMAKAATPEDREATVRRSVELVASLFLKFNDHDPMVPSVGNKLFGGTSSDDTVTVGGVDVDGRDAVCDMTFIVLKAAELLCFQDPNMNAKYYPGVNSPEYLRRLCEVNVNMAASPIIQNDKEMIETLVAEGIPLADARDWAATGCVEPSISGKHYGHTNCMLLNMVAPLEMALNDGTHPVMGEPYGPKTGDCATTMPAYADFLAAYKEQLTFLMANSVEINDYLGLAHQYVHPTPLLSSMFQGPMDKGIDLVKGGATYNSSGVALVSITDAVDSLLAIKELVYDKKRITFPGLIAALARDFAGEGDAALLAEIGRVRKFGSGSEEAVAVAQDLMDYCYAFYRSKTNYRGGPYWPGYWSISYHVGFGMLSGALPSGRRKGKAFTPGLTPAPGSSDQLLENIHAVAALDNKKMPNNIAFNVKLVPHPGDSRARTLDIFSSYVEGYFELSGLQWQSNVISSRTMREAMARPEDYRWLIVRISGYNAYFVKLNRNMQEELVERAEFACR